MIDPLVSASRKDIFSSRNSLLFSIMNKYLIIDCYVDEPSCLGVPPYISPYPRYIASFLASKSEKIIYLTIDDLYKSFKYLDH